MNNMSSWMYSATASDDGDSKGAFSRSGFGDNASHDDSRPESGSRSSTNEASRRQSQVRRRNRLITSCLECRRRKLKCDKTAPCANCTRFQRDCVYLAGASQQTLANVKEKMGALEKDLERQVAKKSQTPSVKDFNSKPSLTEYRNAHDDDEDDDDSNVDELDDYLEPTPLAIRDNVYEDDADDDVMDLGVQIGKMRMTERLGGWTRPKFVQELNNTLRGVDEIKLSHQAPRQQISPKSFIGPGPDYIAPSSSFFFPGTSMRTSLIDYLPSRNAADQLISQYWKAVHGLCRIVFRPTLEAQYVLFWNQITAGNEPVPSLQAIVFAAMFSAAVSMTSEQTMQDFGTSKESLVESFRSGTEMALAKANFLRTAKVDTIQAFVMYLLPLVRGEVSRAHSALVGTAIRLAECIGLHRDGALYNLTPVEVHVRRMIWHQLCFLDMKTCEATGPRPQIRREDYDTKLPLNVNDVDLLDPKPPTEDKPVWTDVTLFRIRCECMEMRRKTWHDIMLIDKKKKSLTSVLVKIQKFNEAMVAKYSPLVDYSVPFQRMGSFLLIAMSKTLFVQVLHRYMFYSGENRMPDRLRQVVVEAGLTMLENIVAYETDPQMQPWNWYRGAFNHQYHSAMMLLTEVYLYPMRKEAVRIWKCLDYVFEIPPHLPPKHKAELVLTALRDRMEVYHQLRKVRGSKQMENNAEAIEKSFLKDSGGAGNATNAAERSTQDRNIGTSGLAPSVSLSPPSIPLQTESSTSGSQQGSHTAERFDSFSVMEDIDWVNLHFPRLLPREWHFKANVTIGGMGQSVQPSD